MQTWTCGPLVLEEVLEYKYLGHVINTNLTNKSNMQHKKGLIEAALAICLAVASDEVLHHIKLDSLVQLYNSCLVPITLYGTEVWTDKSFEPLEQLQHKCLNRILNVPTSTPNAATTIEFGNLPMKTLVHRRQLSFYYHLRTHPDTLAGQILMKQEWSANRHIRALTLKGATSLWSANRHVASCKAAILFFPSNVSTR